MDHYNYPVYPTGYGYLTERVRRQYIDAAIAEKLLPAAAHRLAKVISLDAPSDLNTPIQFWQLYSVLGQDNIVGIVRNFYSRVFDDEAWFKAPFERIGGIEHHVFTQASMWLDAMGAGAAYHGGEFRLNFHHVHNAKEVMNEKGAKRWVHLMVEALDHSKHLMTEDPRVRPSINTFLSFFFGKYATDFGFQNLETFGATNPPVRIKINFMNMTANQIEAMSEEELRDALADRGVDVSLYEDKAQLVNKAMNL